jgi:hypothetical protein
MSWDIVIFKLSKKVSSVEEIDESVLENVSDTAFKAAINNHFPNVEWQDGLGRIVGSEYEIEFYDGDEGEFSNIIFRMYGEMAIYALIDFCKKNGWQAFDTGLGEMLDLDHPERNGYQDFQNYLAQVLGKDSR